MLLPYYMTLFVPEPSISFSVSHDCVTLTVIGIIHDVTSYSFTQVQNNENKNQTKWKIESKNKKKRKLSLSFTTLTHRLSSL